VNFTKLVIAIFSWLRIVRSGHFFDINKTILFKLFFRYSCNSCLVERAHAPDEDKIDETIETCIKSKDPECSGDKVKQLLLDYLCGTTVDGCKKPKTDKEERDLVAQIKRNVLQGYFVIGILEEIELSLKLMELMLPGNHVTVKNLSDFLLSWQ
jgi:hypothetical protein